MAPSTALETAPEKRDSVSGTANPTSTPPSTDLEKAPSDESPVEDMRPGAKAGLTLTRFWIIMFGLNVGMLLTALDFNIIATAVPIISSEFHSYSNSAWLGTGFLVSFSLVLPLYSKLGDIFGRRNMFLVGTCIFILGSGLCGGSKSMEMLIWSRVIQGIGGGGIYGLVNVIVTDLVPLRDVGKYISFTALVWAIADVAGPLLGGAFSHLVITAIVGIPNPKIDKARLKHLDVPGALTLIGGTTCFLLAISWGGNNFPWDDSRVIGCFVGGFALLATFIVWENWAEDPLVPPMFWRKRAIVSIFASEFFYGVNLLGMMYYVPQFFQLVYGDSATMSGVALLPMMLGLAVGNPFAGWLTSKHGWTLANALVGAALVVLSSGLITRWGIGTSRAESVIELIILGIGQGAVMEGLLVGSHFRVEPMHIGLVTGMVIFMQTVGDIFGIAIFSSVYQNELRTALSNLALTAKERGQILADVQTIRELLSGDLLKSVVAVYANSLQNGWWWLFACSLASLLSAVCAIQWKKTA